MWSRKHLLVARSKQLFANGVSKSFLVSQFGHEGIKIKNLHLIFFWLAFLTMSEFCSYTNLLVSYKSITIFLLDFQFFFAFFLEAHNFVLNTLVPQNKILNAKNSFHVPQFLKLVFYLLFFVLFK